MFINDRQITLSVGASRKATVWHPQIMLVSELYERLRTPARGTESYADYMAMKKAEQDELKDVGGFVGGALRGVRRKAGAVAGRDILTLDLDNLPAGGTDDILRRLGGLGCGYCVYSTRKHHPGAPRLRVLIPTDRTLTADEYEPVARRMAAFIDPGMTPFDPSTFEASRLMYWPSCCTDSEYIYTWEDKPLASVDGLLATYPNWRDTTAWPQVPGAAVSPQRLVAKQGDPTTKPGVVGAFCRVYDVYRAMDELLPGVYEQTDIPDRYTYTGGSTTGGAVVYDDGKFLFSHHATDPCSGRLVNAFDLVRLHKYGDLDDEAKEGTPTNRLPSYTAMCAFAAADTDVFALMAQERYDEAQKDFEGVQATNTAEAPNWMRQLKADGQGKPEKTLKNYKKYLRLDPQLDGAVRLNLFTGRVDICGPLPWERPAGSPLWGDTDTTNFRVYLEPQFGKTTKNDIDDAVAAVAAETAYHPVRDYLNTLAWDGVPRLDTLFIDYLGATDNAYIRAVTRKAFAAAVARIMTPGVKYDTMPVLIGAQGRHKSSILAKMGGAWFSDSLKTFDGKEAMETIQGTWINEISEMQAMERSEINAVKAFLSKLADYYRAAYGRHVMERLRQCVFFGTTNSKDCLRDTTGGRRFWPIDIDVQPRTKNVFRDLDGERDQMWAEAVFRWRLGEPLHLPTELEAMAGIEQEAHRERHPWEGQIEQFIEKPVPPDWPEWDLGQRRMFFSNAATTADKPVPRTRVCAAEIWCEMLGRDKSELQQRTTREINQLLEKLPGWDGVGVRYVGLPYGKQRSFDRIVATDLIEKHPEGQQIEDNRATD